MFSANLCMLVNTISINVHYSSLPSYYSPLSFMTFIHFLKNLWLLFLEQHNTSSFGSLADITESKQSQQTLSEDLAQPI